MARHDPMPDDLRRHAGIAKTNGHYPHTFTAAELMAFELAPVRWVVPDILHPKALRSWPANRRWAKAGCPLLCA
jgi:hypothetical protein